MVGPTRLHEHSTLLWQESQNVSSCKWHANTHTISSRACADSDVQIENSTEQDKTAIMEVLEQLDNPSARRLIENIDNALVLGTRLGDNPVESNEVLFVPGYYNAKPTLSQLQCLPLHPAHEDETNATWCVGERHYADCILVLADDLEENEMGSVADAETVTVTYLCTHELKKHEAYASLLCEILDPSTRFEHIKPKLGASSDSIRSQIQKTSLKGPDISFFESNRIETGNSMLLRCLGLDKLMVRYIRNESVKALCICNHRTVDPDPCFC